MISSDTGKAACEPKTRTNSVAVARTLDITKAREEMISLKFKAKGDFLHGVSAIRVRSIVQHVGKGNREIVPIVSRCATFCSRAPKERPPFGNFSTRETFCTVCQLFQRNHFLQNIGKNIFKKFRMSRTTTRFVKEREKSGPPFGIIQQGGQNSRHPNALSYEQLGCCAEFFLF